MANLTPSWGTCHVDGTWVSGNHNALRPGGFTVTYPRTRNIKQKAIAPAGVYATGALNTDPGTPLPSGDTDPIVGKSFSMDLPATDDPDLRDALKVQIDITFGDGGKSETYIIDLPTGGTIHLDELQPTSIGTITQTTSSLKLGKPGGVALLDAAGDVIDADGNKVVAGGGGTGTVTSVNGQFPVDGEVALTAGDVGADAAGAAAAAVSAHAGAADPHPQYLTPAEASAAYAPASLAGTVATLASDTTDALDARSEDVYWDPDSRTWGARSASTRPVTWWSTNDPTATVPNPGTGLHVGDEWKAHKLQPDA